MRALKQIIPCSLLAFFAASGVAAETNGFLRQTITLPAKAMPSRFVDLDNHGRSDLLAVNPITKELLIYRQRPWGFTNTPDQVIELPPQTAWIAPYQMESHGSLELLMSTATGLVHYRQNGGAFESEPRTLIKADQVFTNDNPPSLISLGTNAPLPVISATQAWLYQRNNSGEWTSAPPVSLEARHSTWAGFRTAWTLGQNSSHYLSVDESCLSKPDVADDEKPENEGIGKLMTDLKKADEWHQPVISKMDLNRDGQGDFILWQTLGNMDPKTDVYVYLRGADGKLPERPTQVLHCRGLPIPVGSPVSRTPVADLKGDGSYELVLLEPKLMIGSASSLLDTTLSRGVDMALTIRSFNHGAFASSVEASIPVKTILSWYGTSHWPFFVCGDFNGDGRPDLVVQRTDDQWDIFPSTADGRWFKPRPDMGFEMPMKGYFERQYFEITELNGNGRSDIILRDVDDPRIFVFLTQPQSTKGNP